MGFIWTEQRTDQFCTWKNGFPQLRALMCSISAFGISGMVLTVKYAEQNHAEQNSGSCGEITHTNNPEYIFIF